jgi:hypothetical protein
LATKTVEITSQNQSRSNTHQLERSNKRRHARLRCECIQRSISP